MFLSLQKWQGFPSHGYMIMYSPRRQLNGHLGYFQPFICEHYSGHDFTQIFVSVSETICWVHFSTCLEDGVKVQSSSSNTWLAWVEFWGGASAMRNEWPEWMRWHMEPGHLEAQKLWLSRAPSIDSGFPWTEFHFCAICFSLVLPYFLIRKRLLQDYFWLCLCKNV